MHLLAGLAEVDLDANLAVLEALEHAAKPLAARRSAPSVRSWPRVRPSPRSPTAAPAAGRCRARKPPAGRRRRSDRARRAAARSPARWPRSPRRSCVPSGRSAMICTVLPSRPDTATRTRRKPRSLSAGSTSAATRAAAPRFTNEPRRAAAPSSLSVHVREAFRPSFARSAHPKQKERTQRAHSQS